MSYILKFLFTYRLFITLNDSVKSLLQLFVSLIPGPVAMKQNPQLPSQLQFLPQHSFSLPLFRLETNILHRPL